MRRTIALMILAATAAVLLVPGLGAAKCSATPPGTGTTLPGLDGRTDVVVNHNTYVGGQGSASQQSGALYANVGTADLSLAGFYLGGARSSPTAAQGCIQVGVVCFAVPQTLCTTP